MQPPQYDQAVQAQQPVYNAQPYTQQPYPQQDYPQQGYPQQTYPQQGYPQQTVVLQQPQPVMTTTATIVSVQRPPGEQDIMPAAIIFLVGWFGICCVWLGGFAYVKSKNPTARALGILSVVCYFSASVGFLIWLIWYIVFIVGKVNNDCYYYNYYDYYYGSTYYNNYC